MLDLQPIRARLAAATSGPWRAIPWYDLPQEVAPIAEVSMVGVFSDCPVSGSPAQDADLIANAPTDLAALVTEVERLRAENETLRRSAQIGPSSVISTGRWFNDA